MDTVSKDRTYDEFVKKLLIIMQGHFEEASMLSMPGDGEEGLVKYQIVVRQSGLEAVIDTLTR
jgi:hypothetical protein